MKNTADISRQEGTVLVLYVVETAISKFKVPQIAIKSTQDALDQISNYCVKWKIVNVRKSQKAYLGSTRALTYQ